MTVYQSFFDYKGGPNALRERWGDDFLYFHTVGDKKDKKHGGHAVSLHGWGVGKSKDGKESPFWVGRNSWGESWGLKGLFKIVKGSNTAGIEKEVYFVEADPE